MNRPKHFTLLCLVAAVLAITCSIGPGWAVTPLPNHGGQPDYFTTPNWANTPPLRKFVDTLPGLGPTSANNLGQYIPVANPDTTSYPGSDYYEIGLRDYFQQMHSDLPLTKLRGYYQINDGTVGATDHSNHYLGPLIIATKDRPVRIKFVNKLGIGSAGNLFLPVDTTIMGSGPYEINFDPETLTVGATRAGSFTQNRATLHLHGGRSPWISDGTPHQWITPPGENPDYPKGVSVAYVPDMWYDATGVHITETTYPGSNCAGNTTCGVGGSTNNPGPGAQTFYWSNQQSGRLMFYHDHAWGITRLNVYAGEAAGYLLTDQTEQDLIASGIIPAEQIPLVIQDKTFVDEATIGTTDPTWNWGTSPGSAVTGDLWWPHVYMPAQNPYNPNMSGINDMGRWHYGPWFFPSTPVCGSSPQAVKPMCIEHGTVPNPLYNPACDPSTAPNNFCQPPEIPGTPNPSWGAEAFLDTPVINGTAYPKVTVQPRSYRLRILNAAHDRFLNLQFYQADPAQTNPACPDCAPNSEVRMVPASPTPGFPPNWPTDGREGGVPDPATAGPEFIQIGTEGGFLPQPVVLPNQPIVWNMDPTMFNVGNVLQQRDGGGTLILAPAERADVIVDFSAYAGKTLILYNDAPTAFPALDPHYDYYTGAPDRTDIGGAPAIPVGLGPNVRTILQIQVAAAAPAPAYNLAALQAAFNPGPTSTGVFAQSQSPIIVGQSAYNSTYNTTFPFTWPYWGLSRISDGMLSFQQPDGTMVSNFPMMPKAIHDEMGGTFDDYGRMSAKLGLEAPFTNAAIANFILQNYVDPPTEIVKAGDYQIWRITHNGVDTHPIHFHLFEVQLLNRVGWDGFIRLPDPNELGWKDTLRISPLEDTIVALRPVQPTIPFPLPDSIRPLNPERPVGVGDMMGFSNIDPTTGNRYTMDMTNDLFNFGWEYVWHCHILSHEENDMMRSIVFQVAPEVPTSLFASGVNPTSLTWLDNSASETGFTLQRDTDPAFPAPVEFTIGPSSPNTSFHGAIPYNDDGTVAGPNYFYRVRAFSPNGNSAWSNIATPSAVPLANLSVTAIAFASQLVGTTSAAQTVTLSNSGTVDMTGITATLGGANPGDFGRTTACGTLAPGSSCAIDVTFAPMAAGAFTANLSITSDAVNSPVTVALSGTGTAPFATASPASLSFAAQPLNTTATAQIVTVSNTGTATLSNLAATLGGTNPGEFAAANSCGTILLPGLSCSISVTFTPTAAGTPTATLTITSSDAAHSPITIAISGTGIAQAAASLAPTALAFGDQTVATVSAAQIVTLSNTGSAPLSVATAVNGLNAGDFVQTNTCGTGLAVGASCTYSVTFAPTALGARSASLVISTNDPLNPTIMVGLTGNGIAPVAVMSPAVLSFGTQMVNIASTPQTVTLLNSGNKTMTIAGVGISGTNATDYTISTTTCGGSLSAGTSCTISVTFLPPASGARAALLTITSDATNSPTNVALSGTGTAVLVTPSAILFTDQMVGTAGTQSYVKVFNGGTAALAVNSITLTGANAADFTITSNSCGTSLAAGRSCTVVIRFRPTALGLRTATLSIRDADPTSPQTVALSGTGIGAVASVTPTSLSFGNTLRGTVTAPQAVTVSNTGTAALTFNSFNGLTIGGTNASQFTIAGGTCANGATLVPGASCTVNVAFAPRTTTALGTKTATLYIRDNAVNGRTQTVALSGTATAALAKPLAAPAAASTLPATSTATATVTAPAPALGVSTRITGSASAPAPVPAATAATVETSGSPLAAVTPETLKFTSQALNIQSAPQVVTLSNSGTGPLAISNIGLSGAGNGDYTMETTCGDKLAAGANCAVTIVFSPIAPDAQAAELIIETSDPVHPAMTVVLSGTIQ